MVESKLVELVVAGSNPVGHPTFYAGLEILVDFPDRIPDNSVMKSEFPKEISKGSCTVTIYETPTKDYPGYTLVYYQGGKRKRETSADLSALRSRADEVLDDLKDGRTDTGALKASERADYFHAIDLLKPTGQPLHVAVSHFAKAVEILGGDMVIAAAQDYVKRHMSKIKPRLVSEVVVEMLDEKRKQKRSDRHVYTLESHLNRFGSSVVKHIATVTAPEIDAFLDGLNVGARTRDNNTSSIVSLFQWAKKKRYLPSDFDEASRITRLDNHDGSPIDIYTPAEIDGLLRSADANLIPFLAIGAFAGLRSSEIMRLDWADVKMENGSSAIVVQQGKVKKRGKARRIVPVSENLSAWLTPHAQTSGPVWSNCEFWLYKKLKELVPLAQNKLRETDSKAKLEWKSNALRHSCISYRVALIKNVPQVALESGNSPQMIDSNYREVVTEQDAKRWFAIMPKK